jgi:hypothetical protein
MRMRIRNRQSMVKIITYVYATIILHNLCVKTPYQNDWLIDNGDSDSDSEDGCATDDGLNVTINPDNENSTRRDSVHNYLYRKLLS